MLLTVLGGRGGERTEGPRDPSATTFRYTQGPGRDSGPNAQGSFELGEATAEQKASMPISCSCDIQSRDYPSQCGELSQPHLFHSHSLYRVSQCGAVAFVLALILAEPGTTARHHQTHSSDWVPIFLFSSRLNVRVRSSLQELNNVLGCAPFCSCLLASTKHLRFSFHQHQVIVFLSLQRP